MLEAIVRRGEQPYVSVHPLGAADYAAHRVEKGT